MFDGIMGAIDGVMGGLDGGGGGDFLSELMDVLGGSNSQGSGNNSTMGEIGQIAGDVLPLVAGFL